MITFFTTMRPYITEFAMRSQYNSVCSWQWAAPGAQVLIMGDAEGIEEFSADMGAQFVDLELRWSRPYLDYMIGAAQAMAEHDVLCLINGDIMLWPDFVDAVRVVQKEFETFLMIGRRVDLLGHDQYDKRLFAQHEMPALKEYARKCGGLYPPTGSDYFAFRGDVWGEVPHFIYGCGHDSWLMWRALSRGTPMVDATWTVLALHQSHQDARVCQEANIYNHTLVPQPWGENIRGVMHATHSAMGSKQFAPARSVGLRRS